MNVDMLIQEAGGTTKVAALFGITSQAVSQWTRIPRDRCLPFAKAFGFELEAVMQAERPVPAPREGKAA